MKHLIITFVMLFAAFLGIWSYKINTPINRPDEYAEGYQSDAGAWWETGKASVDESWQLDHDIPSNFMPVPGEDNLFMAVGNDGKILGYKKRIKQIDGSWKWEDVNPDIPDNYEPVEGMKNVYKVTAEDGTVTYLKYIRNEDDTYAFVEVNEQGEPLERMTDATTIDGKHVHITGNVYSLLNDHGVVIGYDKRIENEDGSFSWMPTELSELPSFDIADNKLGDSGSLSQNVPSLDQSAMDQMAQDMANANNAAANGGQSNINIDINVTPEIPNMSMPGAPGIVDLTPDSTTVVNNEDGTHTEIEIVKETKNIDGWISTYETYVKKTYDDAGNLLSSISEGPYEVHSKREEEAGQAATEAPSVNNGQKENTLEAEIQRVTPKYTYHADISNTMLALLNQKRIESGLPELSSSADAEAIARLRAADMAGYNTSEENLPTYGALGSMLSAYGISSKAPGENLWKSIVRDAPEIHERLQSLDSANKIRMNSEAEDYGAAVVESNGYYYICEIIL